MHAEFLLALLSHSVSQKKRQWLRKCRQASSQPLPRLLVHCCTAFQIFVCQEGEPHTCSTPPFLWKGAKNLGCSYCSVPTCFQGRLFVLVWVLMSSVTEIRTDQITSKLSGFMPLKIIILAFPSFPVKCKAAPKAANKPLGLFVLGFTMQGAAKDHELTAKKRRRKRREKEIGLRYLKSSFRY